MAAHLNSSSTRRVILVGWDGADWKIASPLVDAGQMPQLANIVTHGASGPLASIPPYLSPMLWNSIATGKYADQHGILGFTTVDPAGRLAPITSTQRKCKAIWNILSEHGLNVHVLGWFASHPAENVTGVCVTEAFPRPVAKGAAWPLAPGSVHPPEFAEEMARHRVRPEDVDPNLLRQFVPRADEIDLARDKRLEQLAIRIAELYSVHNATIATLRRGPCDFLAVYYHFIDWICHDFMDFHPPRRPHIPEREFEWYKDVVNAAYRLQDVLLRDLLAHAGPDSTVIVCSDHGFASDAQRPLRVPMVSAGIAIWHRAQGLFAAAGPGIMRDVLVAGATVLDIAPTILRLLGFPPANDMDGRPLESALKPDPAPAHTIESYELDPGSYPRPRHLAALSHSDQTALLEQFAALGYVDLSSSTPRESAAQRSQRDNMWNLAITLRHAGKHEAALELLQRVYLERPEDARYAYHLALCQLHLGLVTEATSTAEAIADFTPGNVQAHLLLAELALAREDAAAALAHLEAAETAVSSLPSPASISLLRGQALLLRGDFLAACVALRSAAEHDPENPAGWLGYAQGLLGAGRAADAETCAREAVALAPTMARAHLALGEALAQQANRRDEARVAFLRARELNPRLIAASRALDRLQGKPFTVVASSLEDELRRCVEPATAETSRQRLAFHQAVLKQQRAQTRPVDVFVPLEPTLKAPDRETTPFVIVSGLPRSGTSLMMQMLAQGGLAPMTDRQRGADIDNPEGYFEWEDVKRLPQDPELITQAKDRAVKIVSPLLVHLPPHYRYKIIFMVRPPEEIARSQEKMRARLSATSGKANSPNAAVLEPLLAQHAKGSLANLSMANNVALLTVDYPSLIRNPAAEAQRIAEFIGSDLLPTAEKMPMVVRPELYRQRKDLD